MPGAYVCMLSIVLCRQFFVMAYCCYMSVRSTTHNEGLSVVAPHILHMRRRVLVRPSDTASILYCTTFIFNIVSAKFRAIRSPIVLVEQHRCLQVFFMFLAFVKSVFFQSGLQPQGGRSRSRREKIRFKIEENNIYICPLMGTTCPFPSSPNHPYMERW